jgi:hypothetical protein
MKDPQFCSDLWKSLFSDALCSVHVNWYTFFICTGRNYSNCPENVSRNYKKFSRPGDKGPRDFCIRGVRCNTFHFKWIHIYQVICINNRHFSWILFHSCDEAPRLNTALKPYSSLLLYRHTQYVFRFLARQGTKIERENDCKFITITQRNFQAYDVQNKWKYALQMLVFTSLLTTKDRKLAHTNLNPRFNKGANTSEL